MKPTVGRIVMYVISEQDAIEINRRRTNSFKISEAIKADKWSMGAQAHIGNVVSEGDVVPMIITVVWSDALVSGQAFLDGNDTFWCLSRHIGDQPGTWSWPIVSK